MTEKCLYDAGGMERITEKSFNEIIWKKTIAKAHLPKDYDFLENNGNLYEEYALDSLDVMELIMEFEDIYNIRIDDRLIKGIYTVRDLWNLIKEVDV